MQCQDEHESGKGEQQRKVEKKLEAAINKEKTTILRKREQRLRLSAYRQLQVDMSSRLGNQQKLLHVRWWSVLLTLVWGFKLADC